MSRPLSVRSRILLLFLFFDLVLIAAFTTSTYVYMRKRLTRSFDASLQANAELIATLVVYEEDGLQLEFSDEIMTRFSRRKHPDIFAVLDQDGKLVEVSRSMKEKPDWFGPREGIEKRDFLVKGEDDQYRSIILPTHANVDEEEQQAKPPPITVLFATSREDLDDDLEDALEFLVLSAGVMIVVSLFAGYFVAKRSLLPLYRLADDAGRMDANSLGRRFDLSPIPTDIRPLADSFNHVLSRLQDAFERERLFSSDAAHELRTPVSVIKSCVQSTLLSAPDSPRDREALQEILLDVERLEELCESLLLLNTPPPDLELTCTLSPEIFLLEIQDIVSTFIPAFDKAGSKLNLTVQEISCENLCSDTMTARRILTNLLTNALRHGGSGVYVSIVISAAFPHGIAVSVHDTGPGVPDALRNRLFQRFARGDASRTRTTGGAGLGLAISRSLAERFGGTLKLETHDSVGATFVWHIPTVSQ